MRFTPFRTAALGAAALALVGCASSQAAGSGSVASQAASGALGPALIKWSGTFRPRQQADGTFGGLQQLNQTSGSVTLTSPAPHMTQVHLTLNVSFNDSVQLPWAVASGACGSNAIPLMTVSQFPEILVTNGRGTIDQQFSLDLPTAGTYHVNVYQAGSSGQDESTVIACSDLTVGRR